MNKDQENTGLKSETLRQAILLVSGLLRGYELQTM